jgi:hypothetical protein
VTAGPDPSERATPGEQPPAGAAPNPHQIPTPPLEVAPAPPAVAPVQASLAVSGDQCPNCNARMAADQRYCLECGQRRGDPRLPFMDAVVFMDAVKQPRTAAPPPSPPHERKPRISANASLIAGIATLILAIGVGVLIGRSGGGGSTPVANNSPQVIKVENGGGGSGGAGEGASTGSKKANTSGGGGKKKAKGKSEAGSSGTSKAAEEVLKPAGDVKLPPPTTKVGGKCEKGTAGCSESGEFNGEFFGE